MQTWLDFGAIVTMIALIYTIGKDISERNRRQAYSISCWIDGDFPLRHDDGVLPVIVSNPSEQPIYDAVVAIDIVDDIPSLKYGIYFSNINSVYQIKIKYIKACLSHRMAEEQTCILMRQLLSAMHVELGGIEMLRER